jgi:glycosyltransferase involved in cell wall biosynthesis
MGLLSPRPERPEVAAEAGKKVVESRLISPKPELSVVLVVPSLTFGGAERQVTLLATALRARGHSVRVVAFEEGGVFSEALEQEGVSVSTFPRGKALGAVSLARFGAYLRRVRPTIVHSFLWSANLRSRIGCFFQPRVKTIISLRGFDDELRWYHQWAERLVDGRTDVVVANCVALAEEARRRGIGRAARHEVIYNGIESASAEPDVRHQPGPELRVGFIGRLERKKNPLALVPAVAPLCREFPTLKIVVVGDGALGKDLKEEIARHGLLDRFELVGYQKDVLPWYGRLTAVVNTSISEGCCNVILEASRAGLPVVATAVGGNKETVVHGATGLLVPEGKPEAMSEALRRILGEPDLARSMGQKARELVSERFSLSQMVTAYLELYRGLAGIEKGAEGR